MADTVRNLATLQGLLANNVTQDASLQDIRDFLASVYGWENDTTPANSVTFAGSGGAILGESGGNSGKLTFIASDNDQATIAINASDQLVFQGAAGGYLLQNGPVYMQQGMASIGVNDTTQGILNLYGANTVLGGILNIYPPADSQGTVAIWSVASYIGTTFTIGSNTGGNLFELNSAGNLIVDGNLIAANNRLAIRTVSNSLANNAAGTVGDMAIGTDGNTYSYIWFATNTPSRAQYVTW